MLTDYDRITRYNTEVIYVSPEGVAQTRDFLNTAGKPIPFPVAVDSLRAVVKTYKLEKPTDKRVEVIPSMFLIDQTGTLRFKYVAQDAADRPPIGHLEEILRVVTTTAR